MMILVREAQFIAPQPPDDGQWVDGKFYKSKKCQLISGRGKKKYKSWL